MHSQVSTITLVTNEDDDYYRATIKLRQKMDVNYSLNLRLHPPLHILFEFKLQYETYSIINNKKSVTCVN